MRHVDSENGIGLKSTSDLGINEARFSGI